MKKSYSIFVFCLLLTFTSCDSRAQNSYISHPDSSPLSYLALGDSYTIGHKVEPDQRWPVQFVRALRDSGIAIGDAKIIAKNGWTTVDLRNAIKDANLDESYDMVSLLIGVNDQYDGLNFDNYPDRFRFLLKKAIMLAGGRADHVFVVSIPDYSVTPFGQERNPGKIHQELENYNATNKSIAESFKVHYINITPKSQNAKNDDSLVASDGLHPSGKMYSQWVEEIVPVLLPEIKSWPIIQP